jgi:beta-lactamase regulating signal transducer with metallopeptidase domain/peptidoglycan/xylan/chitin deacetylase (PgdA/CDA1 family)
MTPLFEPASGLVESASRLAESLLSLAGAVFGQAALGAVGWAILHSLWQGALVALAYACVSSIAKDAGAHVRYACACAALGLLLMLTVATACLGGTSARGLFARAQAPSDWTWAYAADERAGAERAPKSAASTRTQDAQDAQAAPASTLGEWASRRLASFVPGLALFWLAGVALLASRAFGGWLLLLRLRRSARPVADVFEEMLARAARRVRVSRAVRLCRSALVEVPTVVGHLKPIILVPASALTGLTPRQLEAVLAHELAHVRRYDYLVNLLQTAAELILFYHPAAWWLSRRLRAEREHACDDAAVEAAGGDVLLYARALAALEQTRPRATRAHTLALAADGGSLMQRIQRLVRLNRNFDGLKQDSGELDRGFKRHGHKPARRARTRSPLLAAALLASLGCVALAFGRALVPAGAGPALAGDPSPAPAPRREVAVTFVNFPANNIYDNGRLANKTRKLIRSLAANDIRAVAFVNEARLYKEDGTPNETRVGLLREWLDAGHDLGNETAHHTDLYNVSVEEFEQDVVAGEQITSKLLAERGRRLRYFSYPYLNTGATPAAKAEVEKFLAARGYLIHPVTVDNMDWLFSHAYIEALRRDDEQTAARIRAEYVPYMEHMFEFFENYSREVTGREIPQVLMLTAGALNADCFDDLAAMLKRRGYSFVTMEQATADAAYSLPDNYTGRRGDSWIARWAVTKGLPYKDTEEENLGSYMQSYFADFLKKQQAERSKGAGKK